jgi:hypothetical protein
MWRDFTPCDEPLIGSMKVLSQPSCDGTATGSIYVDILNRGSGDYIYAINGVPKGLLSTDGIIDGLTADNYTILVSDIDHNCDGISYTLALVVQEVSTIVTDLTIMDAPSCGGNGTVSVTVSGTMNYKYQIKGYPLSEAQTVPAFSVSLPTGTYELTIFDAKNCKAPAGRFTIGVEKDGFPVDFDITGIEGDCDTESVIEITISSGTTTDIYYYSLDESMWIKFIGNHVIIPATVGLHTIRLMDEDDCISTLDTILLTQDNVNAFTVKVQYTTATSCSSENGIIFMEISPPGTYNYSLDADGLSGILVIAADGIGRIRNLPPGIYDITIDNDDGSIIPPDCPYTLIIYQVEVHQGLDPGVIAAPLAVTPQTFCGGATVANLQAVGTGIKWYSSANVLLLDTHVLDSGAVYYAVQTTLEGCESERKAVTVIIDPEVVILPPDIPHEVKLCDPATLADVPTDGNTNIVWFDQMVGGSEVPLITSLSDGDIYYAALKYGDGDCFSAYRTEVNFIIVDEISKPEDMETPQHFCDGALVANLKKPNNQIVWYATLTGTTQLSDDIKLLNGTTYYAAQQAGGCESVERTPVEVVIDQYDAPFAPSKQTICNKKYISDLIIVGTTIKWYDDEFAGNEYDSPTTTELIAGLTYYASQAAEDCESLRTPIEVLANCYSPKGTVFPFVHTEDFIFNAQFITTVKLYAMPPATIINDKINYIRKQTPIQTVVVKYYDCPADGIILGAPKNPGTIGSTNNPGLDIRWGSLGYPVIAPDTEVLTGSNGCPEVPIGVFMFKNVAPDDYIIEISRKGFMVRYGKITIEDDKYLGHRELLGGDLDGNGVIDPKDASLIRPKFFPYGHSMYNWMYDFDGNKIINVDDLNVIRTNIGAYTTIYQETEDWNP